MSASIEMLTTSVGRPSASVESRLQQLVVLQAADGSWPLSKNLASMLGRRPADLDAAVHGASGSREEVLRAWATALAIAWLETEAADAEDEWRMLAAKARAWLASTSTTPPGGGSWLETAKKFLAST